MMMMMMMMMMMIITRWTDECELRDVIWVDGSKASDYRSSCGCSNQVQWFTVESQQINQLQNAPTTHAYLHRDDHQSKDAIHKRSYVSARHAHCPQWT